MTTMRCSIAVVALIALLATCFGPAIVSDRTLGFRDAANYYYPVFQWQCREWGDGRVPLWNPHDSLGSPSFAETTSSVLYPGKLVFAIPVSFETRYLAYIISHLLLATFAAFWTARSWGASAEGAALCGLSYGFAGSLLFQCHNVVFLVGAAWLPLAVMAAERMITRRSRYAAICLGACLALMTLGGDPQSAYHAGLAAALYAYLSPVRSSRWIRRACCHADLLALAAATGLILSAVQVLPAIEWAKQSERTIYDQPRNLYEALGGTHRAASQTNGMPATLATNLTGLLAAPQPRTHHARSFDYSVAPWQFAELLWPNCSGDFVPMNRRWVSAFPASSRVWTPSLYFGLIPLVLAIRSCAWRRGEARIRWLSWSLLCFGLGSCGWYGVGWMVHELRVGLGGAAPDDVWIGQPVGGLYWWMTTLLPGYTYFRYPAKLIVVASLFASLLAAAGWDQLFAVGSRQLRRPLVVVITVSALLAGLFWLAYSPWAAWVATAPADPLFGPVDVSAAARQLRGALGHSMLVAAVSCFVITLRRIRLQGALLLLVTVVDLGVANRCLIVTVPTELLRAPARLDAPFNVEPQGWRVIRERVGPPTAWSRKGDPSRMADVVRWERDSLFPMHHLPAGVSLIESSGTLLSADMRAVSRLRHTLLPEADLYDSFSAKLQLRPTHGDGTSGASGMPVRFGLVERPEAFPRAWLVGEVIYRPTLHRNGWRELGERTRDVFLSGGRLRDLRLAAVVEGAPRFKTSQPLAGDPLPICHIEQAGPQHVEITASCSQPSLLVVNDLFFPGWRAQVGTDGGRPQASQIYRTNRVMRGIFLPAGQHRIQLDYVPRAFYIGAIASALGWTALVTWWLRRALWLGLKIPGRPLFLAAFKSDSSTWDPARRAVLRECVGAAIRS
jgi:hypothetical protein